VLKTLVLIALVLKACCVKALDAQGTNLILVVPP